MLRRIICEAGFEPVERDTFYQAIGGQPAEQTEEKEAVRCD